MRRNHLLIVGAAVLALTFGACSDDDEVQKDSGVNDGQVSQNDGTSQSDGTTQEDQGAPAVKACAFTCTEDAQCPANFHCTDDGACVMCNEDADCEIDAYAGMYKGGCNTTTHMCMMCGEDADCEMSGVALQTGKCDTASGMCIACSEDADCEFTGTTYVACGDSNVCVACNEDADCDGNAAGSYCVNNTCAPCKADADCADAAFKGCDVATGYCIKCTTDDECAGDLTCDTDSGACQCATAEECTAAFYPDGTDLTAACE